VERDSFARVHYRRVLSEEEESLLKQIKEQEELENKLEQETRRDLSRFLKPYAGEIRQVARSLGWMDWALARVTYALEEGAVLPEVSEGREILLKGVFILPSSRSLPRRAAHFTL
jgi:DNA mismatch repair ATPase MutS